MAAKLARSVRGHAAGAADGDRSLLKVGDLLANKYRVTRLLGEGGMGVVVEAYHELLDQRVAVKLLYQDVADREAQSRLLLEARSAAKLQSDHVARVVDVDVGSDGLPFIVMELLEGSDLSALADARGPLPRWMVVDYILQALEGLAHAHGRGIVHRDLKPSNLFLATRPDGSQIIKILDFGISKSQDHAPDRRTAQLTGGRSVLGSPPYMSPEQVRSPKSVDHRTDIWSLGICMYELLTNSMPFGGEELQETFAQILEKEPSPIRALVAGVPEGLEQVILRCLSKNREHRFADVGELAKALVPFGSGTWIQSADRVQATLARSLMEDLSSGMRLRGPASGSERISIPSSPSSRRAEPEFHGTANTVAGTYPPGKRRHVGVLIGLAVASSLVGIALIVVTYLQKAPPPIAAAAAPPAETPSAEAPPPPKVVTASPETDVPSSPLPAGTVLGASPLTTAASALPAASSKKPVRAVAPARTAPKPVASASARSLPQGLPSDRSGQ